MLTTEKLYDAFREPEKIRGFQTQIIAAARQLSQPVKIMEVCGGHTFAIVKYGLDQLMPPAVQFIHGPGCPVCVMPQHRIDAAIQLAQMPDTILVALGDMIKVPGSSGSLQQARAAGAGVQFVYSPLDALDIARSNPEKKIIYFAIGFETTTPMTALLADQALLAGLSNLFFHINHVLTPPAMTMLLEHGCEADAFIAPGHVSVITGSRVYEPFATDYGSPIVIAGFEPLEILDAVYAIIQQINSSTATVDNKYSRAVKTEGNLKAQQLVKKYFVPRDSFIWRGIGSIAASALKLRHEYAAIDAEVQFPEYCPQPTQDKPNGCLCGNILMGKAVPEDCPLFSRSCTPTTPQGSCMVSNEGACAAYYKYRRHLK